MKLRHIIAAAFAVGTAFAAPAQAGVLAAADLTIRSLFIVDTTTGAPVTSGITITRDGRTGTAAADFNGVSAIGPGPSSISSTAAGATVDVKQRCAGPDCGTQPIPENNTTIHLTAPAGNFALGDMYLSGSAISASGANGLTRADASIANSTNEGGANSTILNGVTATTQFVAGANMSLAFGMTYDAFLKVFMDTLPAGDQGYASAGYAWHLTLTDNTLGTSILDWSPSDLNKGFTASSADESREFSSTHGGVPLFSNTVSIASGHTYGLTVTQNSNAVASQVPEPGSIMLIGLGLAGLGASVRRRRAR